MSQIILTTVSDLRTGRQSWRVFLLVCTPSSATALFVAGLVQ